MRTQDGSGSGDYDTTMAQIEYDTGSGDYVTEPTTSPNPQVQRCNYLNDIRANYTACCKYPALVIW